jgi:hypothetical protein
VFLGHPQIAEVQALYAKVATIVIMRYPLDAQKWLKAIDDEIADSKARNNQNALKCPIVGWSDHTSDGK